jgi:hypothetical protein
MCAIILLSFFSECGLTAFAQSGTSSLRGILKDPSGATVAKAEVILKNSSTGLQRATTSGQQGEYQLLQVTPGSYSVEVHASGFAPAVSQKIDLLVDTPATLNFNLQIGAVETDVQVSSGDTGMNTADATLGHPFDQQQILALPSEGRNPVELLSLQAGVAYLGTNTDASSDSRSGAVNGARSDQSNITVDGLDNNDQLLGSAFTGTLRMPMDSLEEFRVTTSNANADAGRSSGAQVSLVTKSGTNALHGSLYWYNRTRFGVANDWFNKQAQIEEGEANKPGQLIRNTFGASLGGPILRNRLFFFAICEGQRSREAVQKTQSVPLQSLRNGTVNYTGEDGNRHTLTASDLRSIDTGCTASGTCPNGGGPNNAVVDLWNGESKLADGSTIPVYPQSNTESGSGADGMNIGGYTFAAPQPQDLNTLVLKLDWNLTSNGNHRIFVRGNLQDDETQEAPQFPGQPSSQTVSGNNKGIAAGYTAILTPQLINNARFAYVREGNGTTGRNAYSYVGFWNISDPVSFARTTLVNVPVTQVVDDLTWSHGHHTLQFGANWRMVHNNRQSNEQNFIEGSVHPTWLYAGGIANTGQDLDPATGSYEPVDASFAYSYVPR